MKRLGVGVVVAVATMTLGGCSQSAFCDATGVGHTAASATRAYLSQCGPDYNIARGPYDGYKQATPFASYADVVEFTLHVRDNSEGPLAYLLVGRRETRTPWRTLGRPGTGP